MVISKSDLKRRRKNNDDFMDSLSESPKRTKVHAQRKFAQSSNVSSPVITPIKEIEKAKPPEPLPAPPEFLSDTPRPNTEDFVTFLCFRGTSMLPPSLNFFNTASSVSVATQSKESTSRSNEKTQETQEKSDRPFIAFGVRKRADPFITNKMEKKRRQAIALQSLRRKYQEQRIAKLRAHAIEKMEGAVKIKKTIIRTRSNTKITTQTKNVPKIITKRIVQASTVKVNVKRTLMKQKMCLRSRGRFVHRELTGPKLKRPLRPQTQQPKTPPREKSSSEFSSDDDEPLVKTLKTTKKVIKKVSPVKNEPVRITRSTPILKRKAILKKLAQKENPNKKDASDTLQVETKTKKVAQNLKNKTQDPKVAPESKTKPQEPKTRLQESKNKSQEPKQPIEEEKEPQEIKTRLQESKMKAQGTKVALNLKSKTQDLKNRVADSKKNSPLDLKNKAADLKNKTMESKNCLVDMKNRVSELKNKPTDTKNRPSDSKTRLQESKTRLQEFKTRSQEAKMKERESKSLERSKTPEKSSEIQISQRPTRKTKEAASLYMNLLGPKLTTSPAVSDDDSIDSFPELPNVRKTEQRELEMKAKLSFNATRTTRRGSLLETKKDIESPKEVKKIVKETGKTVKDNKMTHNISKTVKRSKIADKESNMVEEESNMAEEESNMSDKESNMDDESNTEAEDHNMVSKEPKMSTKSQKAPKKSEIAMKKSEMVTKKSKMTTRSKKVSKEEEIESEDFESDLEDCSENSPEAPKKGIKPDGSKDNKKSKVELKSKVMENRDEFKKGKISIINETHSKVADKESNSDIEMPKKGGKSLGPVKKQSSEPKFDNPMEGTSKNAPKNPEDVEEKKELRSKRIIYTQRIPKEPLKEPEVHKILKNIDFSDSDEEPLVKLKTNCKKLPKRDLQSPETIKTRSKKPREDPISFSLSDDDEKAFRGFKKSEKEIISPHAILQKSLSFTESEILSPTSSILSPTALKDLNVPETSNFTPKTKKVFDKITERSRKILENSLESEKNVVSSKKVLHTSKKVDDTFRKVVETSKKVNETSKIDKLQFLSKVISDKNSKLNKAEGDSEINRKVFEKPEKFLESSKNIAKTSKLDLGDPQKINSSKKEPQNELLENPKNGPETSKNELEISKKVLTTSPMATTSKKAVENTSKFDKEFIF